MIVNGDEKKLIIVQLSSTFSLKSSKTNSIINVLDCGKRKLSLCRGSVLFEVIGPDRSGRQYPDSRMAWARDRSRHRDEGPRHDMLEEQKQ